MEMTPGRVRRRCFSARVRRELMTKAGGRCSYPGCFEGPSVLQLAHVRELATSQRALSLASEGVDPDFASDNAIVLCSNHHLLVDLGRGTFTSDVLRRMRSAHEEHVAASLSRALNDRPVPGGRLGDIVRRWEAERSISREEHWQEFFFRNPVALAAVIPGGRFVLKSKQYVGGKGWANVGGEVLDFTAASPTNVVCVEIKTPTAPLMSNSPYRSNVFIPSGDVVGGVIQVLENRRSLLETAALLNANSPSDEQLRASSPKCLLIVGDSVPGPHASVQARSFEQFRSALRDVEIVTYGEIFDRIRMLANAIDEQF